MDIKNTYLFEVAYKDGQSYFQGEEDKSLQDEEKNAYYDVHYKPMKPEEDIISFSLVSIKTGDKFTVYMDGHFESRGECFYPAENGLTNFRPIYYRGVNVNNNITYEQKTGKIISEEPQGVEVFYILGWQANDKAGKNVKYSMTVK